MNVVNLHASQVESRAGLRRFGLIVCFSSLFFWCDADQTRRVYADERPLLSAPGRFEAASPAIVPGVDRVAQRSQHQRPQHQPQVPGRRPSRQPNVVVMPQIYPYSPLAPGYSYGSPPATLNGDIEIVPYAVPQRSRSRATYQVVPADPVMEISPRVQELPPPPSPGYFELPPPPR